MPAMWKSFSDGRFGGQKAVLVFVCGKSWPRFLPNLGQLSLDNWGHALVSIICFCALVLDARNPIFLQFTFVSVRSKTIHHTNGQFLHFFKHLNVLYKLHTKDYMPGWQGWGQEIRVSSYLCSGMICLSAPRQWWLHHIKLTFKFLF
jgi:hypothetical protein